jgi:hypothetical protein
MPLLNLPRELRNIIYTYLAVPASPLSVGLYLSCKQLQAEYAEECALALRKYVHLLEGIHPGLYAQFPAGPGFTGTCHLRLSLSTTVFARSMWAPADDSLPTVLMAILGQYFDSITIDFREEHGHTVDIANMRWIHHFVVCAVLPQLENVAAGQVTFDIDVPSKYYICRPYPETWANQPIGLVFYRREFAAFWKEPFHFVRRSRGRMRLFCVDSKKGSEAMYGNWKMYDLL